MSALSTTLILCAVSVAIIGLGVLIKPLSKVFGVLGILWLAAVLPVMFFLNLSAQHVLLFYILSGAVGLIILFGGRPHDI